MVYDFSIGDNIGVSIINDLFYRVRLEYLSPRSIFIVLWCEEPRYHWYASQYDNIGEANDLFKALTRSNNHRSLAAYIIGISGTVHDAYKSQAFRKPMTKEEVF